MGQEMQRSYKALSHAFHPDKSSSIYDSEAVQEFFVQIKHAHNILTDPILCPAYDAAGLTADQLVLKSQTQVATEQVRRKQKEQQ